MPPARARPSSYDRSDVVTSLDDVKPLELASIRDDVRERPPWSSRATASVVLATIALVVAVIAALVGDRVPLGPGRVLSAVLVGSWAVAAVFVAVHRPREALAEIMALAATVGALVLLGAALAGRDVATDTVRDFGAGLRGISIAFLPAVALHLVLGLPDGALCSRARRVWCAAGYAASAVVAGVSAERTTGGRALAGGHGRCARRGGRAGRVHRALSGGRGACTSAPGSSGRRGRSWSRPRSRSTAWVLHELVSWPEPLRAVVVSTTVLVPLSLALGASERIAVRIDRLLVHTITMAGLAGDGGGVVPADRARARPRTDRRREDAPRALDARSRRRGVALDPGARAPHRLRHASRVRRAARARRSAAHVRQPPHPCAPARRAAAPAGRVAEEDDVAERRRGVDPRGRGPARAHGVGARSWSVAPGDRLGGGDRRRPGGRVGDRVGAHLVARHHPRRRRGPAGRPDHEQR